MNSDDGPPSLTPRVDLEALDRLFDLDGTRVFLPGGYGALGEAIAIGFARRGAHVAIAGKQKDKADGLASQIVALGGRARGYALDVRSVSEIARVTDMIETDLGGIDVLVNCVGIQREQPMMEVTEDAFDEVNDVNLKSAMFLAQAVAHHQIAAGRGGRQIHLLSVRAELGLRDRGYSAYCASKGGLAMLVKQHAMELAPHNITVNGVAPTFIRSDRIRPHLERAEFHDFILKRNPLGRIGDPVEIVGPIIALAANAGSYITGQVVTVDGGVTAGQ